MERENLEFFRLDEKIRNVFKAIEDIGVPTKDESGYRHLIDIFQDVCVCLYKEQGGDLNAPD